MALASGIVGGPVATFFISLLLSLATFPGLFLYSLLRPIAMDYRPIPDPANPEAAVTPLT
jgi:hypothetical protein